MSENKKKIQWKTTQKTVLDRECASNRMLNKIWRFIMKNTEEYIYIFMCCVFRFLSSRHKKKICHISCVFIWKLKACSNPFIWLTILSPSYTRHINTHKHTLIDGYIQLLTAHNEVDKKHCIYYIDWHKNMLICILRIRKKEQEKMSIRIEHLVSVEK